MVLTSHRNRAPIREILQQYAGQEYNVFIDESFYKFFDFGHIDGNFAHGAVGIPTSRYEDFQHRIAPAVDEFNSALRKAKGIEPREVKSADLYKLPFNIRRRLMLKLNAALSANGGFIAGFYTSNRGYIMEKIREDLICQDGVTAVPEDYAQLLEGTVKRLKQTASGPGKAPLISELLFLPVVAIANFLSSFGCAFRVVYDPRQAEEDVAVKDSTEGIMGAVMKAEKLGIRSKFLGLDVGKPSHEEFGLQIADLVAGEVRRFFRFSPDLLTSGSDLNLITFEYQDGENALLDEGGKKGRSVPIPPSLLKKALTPGEDCALPYLRKLLAAGMVTCITDFGVERDVMVFEGCFLDLCDDGRPHEYFRQIQLEPPEPAPTWEIRRIPSEDGIRALRLRRVHRRS